MGITLRLRLTGDGAETWLPVAKAHLASINARANASFVRNTMNYPGVRIDVLRGTVVDQIDITMLGSILSVGWTGSEFKVVGSDTARGEFDKRASAGNTVTASGSEIGFLGKGLGITKGTTPDSTAAGGTPDFDSNLMGAFNANIRTTRDGHSFTASTPFYFFGAYNSFGLMEASWLLHGGYWFKDAGVRKFAAGYSGLMVSGNQRGPFFIYEIDGVRGYGGTLTLPNQLAIEPRVSMVGLGAFLMLQRYYRPDYLGSTVVVADCPGISFTYSADAGRTWATTTAGNMFSDFSTVNSLIPPVYTSGNLFNQAIEMVQFQAVQLTATKSFVVATVPYCILVSGTPTLKLKVKYGICDTASFGLFENGVIFDGDPAAAPLVVAYPVKGGALMQVTDTVGGTFTAPGVLKFTADGAAFTTIGTMPFPAYKTGNINSFDQNSIVCPMYDGDHSLYESKDMGASWTKRGTLFKGAPAPIPNYARLLQFGDVTQLQAEGGLANRTPATPWASDCNIEAPP